MKSVLSIQSHVLHGYVGGRAATFPLQFLGWDVDNINTVNFSNHTGYGSVKGSSLSRDEMKDLFKGLTDISCQYDAIILGYIPSADLIEVLAQNVVLLKKKFSDLLYICDTVMGDQGHLYVDKSCVDAYKKLLSTQVVDIITPNQFELELLCGYAINTKAELVLALSSIHKDYSVKHIVVSSLSGKLPLCDEACPESIYCAVSSFDSNRIDLFRIPEIKSYFTGVGDLFTALLVDKFYANPENLSLAVNQVLTIMADVLKLTHTTGLKKYCSYLQLEYSAGMDERILQGKINDGSSMRFFELCIIQARDFYGYSGNGSMDLFSI